MTAGKDWISVKDELPEPGLYVQVKLSNKDEFEGWFYPDNEWTIVMKGYPVGKVKITHWKPLTGKPKYRPKVYSAPVHSHIPFQVMEPTIGGKSIKPFVIPRGQGLNFNNQFKEFDELFRNYLADREKGYSHIDIIKAIISRGIIIRKES